jgi:hypothetical protein
MIGASTPERNPGDCEIFPKSDSYDDLLSSICELALYDPLAGHGQAFLPGPRRKDHRHTCRGRTRPGPESTTTRTAKRTKFTLRLAQRRAIASINLDSAAPLSHPSSRHLGKDGLMNAAPGAGRRAADLGRNTEFRLRSGA